LNGTGHRFRVAGLPDLVDREPGIDQEVDRFADPAPVDDHLRVQPVAVLPAWSGVEVAAFYLARVWVEQLVVGVVDAEDEPTAVGQYPGRLRETRLEIRDPLESERGDGQIVDRVVDRRQVGDAGLDEVDVGVAFVGVGSRV
jgi:hypothetical protein